MSLCLAKFDIAVQQQARTRANQLWESLQEQDIQKNLTRTQVKGLHQVILNATLSQIETALRHKLDICDRQAEQTKYKALKLFYVDVRNIVNGLKQDIDKYEITDIKSADFIYLLRIYFESYCCRLYTRLEEK